MRDKLSVLRLLILRMLFTIWGFPWTSSVFSVLGLLELVMWVLTMLMVYRFSGIRCYTPVGSGSNGLEFGLVVVSNVA